MDPVMVHGDTTAVYTEAHWRPIICALFLASLLITSILTGQRTPMRWSRLRRMEATTVAIMLTLHSSLGFILMSSFVTLGLGTSRSAAVCSLADWICNVFYSTSKFYTSWFLVERARLVHSPHTPRRKCRLYQFNLSLLLIWVGIFISLCVEKKSYIRADGECRIGQTAIPIYAVIAVDFCLSTYLTLLFAYPIFAAAQNKNPVLRSLAIRSAAAGLLCLCSTITNLSMLIEHNGMELSWVCLASCTLDTVWCAIVLVSLTNKRERGELKAQAPSSAGRVTLNYLARTGSRGVEITVDECKVTSGPVGDEIEHDEKDEDEDEEKRLSAVETKRGSLTVPAISFHALGRSISHTDKADPPKAPTHSLVSKLTQSRKDKKVMLGESVSDPADDPAMWRADHHQTRRASAVGDVANGAYNEYSNEYGF